MIVVVGEKAVADRVAEGLAAAGTPVETAAPDRAGNLQPDVVVAAGEAAVVDLVGVDVQAPVLAVGDILDLPSAVTSDVPDAAGWLARGDYETQPHRLLAAEVADERVGRALFDAMLVRSQPGRISEYGVVAGNERSRFRADGVVVATPAGSSGYARAVGGPRLAADADAVAVVPVAAFALGADVLVVDPTDGVRLSVERDEGAVSLLLDGRKATRLSGRETVSLFADSTIEFVIPPGADPEDR